jgi:hypothetical protein
MHDPKRKKIAFSGSAARRLAKATTRLERTHRLPIDQQRTPRAATPWVTVQPAILLTSLGPGSLASPAATGTVQIYRDNDTGFGLTAAETGAVSSVVNASFASGSTVSVSWRNGMWWLVLSATASPLTLYWTRSPTGGIAAAAGSWPNLTGTAFTGAIYQGSGPTFNVISNGATVYWRYKDSDPGSRLIPCLSNGDGTYDAIADSCTAV